MQINNGVYKSGFATTQAAYARAQAELYEALDNVEQRLSQHRFLVGDRYYFYRSHLHNHSVTQSDAFFDRLGLIS